MEMIAIKRLILSADERLIEAACERARLEETTLESAFQAWLAEYANQRQRLTEFDAAAADVCGKLKVGRKLWREEMNAR